MLAADNYRALRRSVSNGHDNVFNSLINAAKELTDQNGRNDVLAQMLTTDNSGALIWAAQNQRFGAIDSILSAALNDDMQRNMLNIAIPLVLEIVIGRGNQINININGAEQIIRGAQQIMIEGRRINDYRPLNRSFLSFLAILSNLPSERRDELITAINHQLHNDNPLVEYLRNFETIFNRPLFNDNQQTPMIEQMSGLWHNIGGRYLNDEALEIIMNRQALEETIASGRLNWERGLNDEIISNFLPQDFNSSILYTLTDTNLIDINDDNRNLMRENNDNLRMIARMAGSPDLELSNRDQLDRFVAMRNLAEGRAEIARQEEALGAIGNLFANAEAGNQEAQQANINPNPSIRAINAASIVDASRNSGSNMTK